MTTFYLLRHAEKAADDGVLAGRTPGIALSATGRGQAERLAQRLAPAPITRVYSSPMQRTRETAAALAQAKNLSVEISEPLGEIDAGEWTGKRFAELDGGDARWRNFNRFRGGTPIPGGESAVTVQARFVNEMIRLRAAHSGEHVALVSHADPIKIALAHFLGAPLDLYGRIEIGLASCSVLQLGDDWAKVLCLNVTG